VLLLQDEDQALNRVENSLVEERPQLVETGRWTIAMISE
jgi:hypothetical protein